MKGHFKRALLLLACGLVIVSCDFGGTAQVSVDEDTLAALTRAINALEAAPEDWESTLGTARDTIAGLGEDARNTASAVSNLYMDAVAFTGVEARCNTDFFGTKLKESLEAVRDQLRAKLGTPTQPKVPTPWVCHWKPDVIKITDAGGHWKLVDTEQVVKIYGFNFDPSNLPKMEIQDQNGTALRTSNVAAAFNTHYELQFDLATEDFAGVVPGAKLALIWPDDSASNRASIQLIPTPEPPTAVPAPTDTPVPPVYAFDVAFEAVTINDDSDPFGSGENYFEFHVNDVHRRWPSAATKDLTDHQTYTINEHLFLCAVPGDQNLDITVNGFDDDTSFGEGGSFDSLGSVRKNYTADTGWGIGFHSEQSSGGDGKFVVQYSITQMDLNDGTWAMRCK